MTDLDAIEASFPKPLKYSYRHQITRQSSTGYSYVGAFIEHRLVAVGHIRRQGSYDQSVKHVVDHPELGNLYVLEEFRGKGIARKLLSHLINILIDEGYTTVGLIVSADNYGARTLYESSGFSVMFELSSRKKAGVNRLYYLKNLK